LKQEDFMRPIPALAVACTALALLATVPAFAPALAQGPPQTVQLAKVDVTRTETGYRASKIIGSSVVNDANDAIGKVDDIIIGTDGMPYVILSVGGFLGAGSKLVVLPYNSLNTKVDKLSIPGASKEMLKALPEFKYASK
jgi:PRC-barrel domain